MIMKAKEFGFVYHEGKKYGIYPYTFHLNQVYNVLKFFGVTDQLILAASWLHDVIEDTECLYEDIYEAFGKELADLTYLVTDKRGKTRAERQLKTYPGIAKDMKGRILKLADRIANMTQSQHEKEKQWLMYVKEYDYFKSTVCVVPEEDDTPENESLILIQHKMEAYLDALVEEGHLCDE